VTAHRAALTADSQALAALLAGLGEVSLPVMWPLHPRTRDALQRYRLLTSIPPSVTICAPLGYLEVIAAVRDATVVITDSGGLQREAYWLGIPCITIRGETEWVETLASGANALLPARSAPGSLEQLVAAQLRRRADSPWVPDAYGDGHAAHRVADAVAALLERVAT
jgi:UDP-N-acetylglucosamine 2-epimerase